VLLNKNSIGAVVVFYNPAIDQANRLLSNLLVQVGHIVIVDNSPNCHRELFKDPSVDYIHKPSNVGIASAHNIGIKQLLSKSCSLGLLLDQDSKLPSDMVQQLATSITSPLAKKNKLAAIGPSIKCSFSQKLEVPRREAVTSGDSNVIFVAQIIASGMMINLDFWAAIGPKMDSLFIDGVDFEWCWRARSLGYQVAYTPSVVMLHTQGEYRRNLGRLSYRVSSPVRLYYQFRNTLLQCRLGHVPIYWKVKSIALLPARFAAQVALEPNKKQRAQYMLKGVLDGLLGRTGKMCTLNNETR
jgi:rhamnosyltransferase